MHSMPDFVAIIERGIASRRQSHFRHFLMDYERQEGGATRPLKEDEIALIKDVVESFIVADQGPALGVAEIDRLCDHLAAYAAQEEMFLNDRKIRRDCFDAVACIKALEARLALQEERNRIMQEHLMMLSHHQDQG